MGISNAVGLAAAEAHMAAAYNKHLACSKSCEPQDHYSSLFLKAWGRFLMA